jgi:hypothetical protein
VRHHLAVAQDWRASRQRGARRRDEIAAKDDVARQLDLSAGMENRDSSASARMMANERS